MNRNSRNQNNSTIRNGIILFADNDPDFLATRAEFVESAGYQVVKVSTLSEAEHMLSDGRVHLAILDIRLLDDDDDKDMSGLTLAQKIDYRSIPKIILTGYATIDAVRMALKLHPTDIPPAVDFLSKQDGPEALIRAVEHAFANHIRINWDLAIDWKDRDRFGLVTLIDPGLEGKLLLDRAQELEDLFRRLFYQRGQIRIDNLLWQRERRIALTVFTFKEGVTPESFVVVLGASRRIMEEAQNYRKFEPKSPGDFGTLLSLKAETPHFAANAYTLAGADLMNVHPIVELYRADAKLFNTALATLFQQTCTRWHQHQRARVDNLTLDTLYRTRLDLTEARVSRESLDARVDALLHQIPILSATVKRERTKLIFQFGGQLFEHPDPTPFLYQLTQIGSPVMVINTPGMLSGDNILVDYEERKGSFREIAKQDRKERASRIIRVWLTDFADAGQSPLLWNFTSLEAAIRFDWIEETDLQTLYEMERRLVHLEQLGKLDAQDVDLPVRRTLRAIQVIRRLAAETVSTDLKSYQLGILFHAAHRLSSFNPAFPLMPTELARMAHTLISAAMIAEVLQNNKVISESVPSNEPDIQIDKTNRIVSIRGTHVRMRGQSYDLICYLSGHVGKLCTRQELVEQVLKEQYEEKGESQISRLNTAIRRLREKIEDNPERPIYLVTEPGGGYRLVPKPGD